MIIAFLVVVGLCFGSFVNALVFRLHMQSKKSSKLKAQSSKYSITKGRSMCPNCKHTLAARDLIPVLSWLELRGKCRYCHKKFDDTPLSELLVSALFVLSYVFWPYTWTSASMALFVLWLMILVGFVALVIYDYRWYLLPNRIIFPLQAIAAVVAIVNLATYPELFSMGSLLLGLLLSAGLFWALFAVSKGKWIGFGDVKLAVVIGLILGRPDQALLMLFGASAIGSLVAVPLLVTGKATRSTRLPFGPFLIVATIIAFLFGMSIINWYKTQLLFL